MKKGISLFLILCWLAPSVWAAQKNHPKIARVLWDKQLKVGKKNKFFPEGAAPVIDGGRIYVGTNAGLFYCLNATNGKAVWRFESNGPIESAAAINGNLVFFGNNKGTVTALEAATGKKVWDSFVGGEILAEPVLSQGDLFVATTSREIYSLDQKTGKENWSTYVKGYDNKITMRGIAPLVFSGNRLYAAFSDGQVVSLSAGSGDIGWSEDLANPDKVFKDIDAGLLMDGGDLYAVGYFGDMARLRKDSGSVVWKKGISSGVTPAGDGGKIFVSAGDGTVVALDKNSGTRQWEAPLGSGLLSAPFLKNDLLLVGTEKNRVYLLDKNTGKVLQKLVVGPFIGEAAATDSTLYFLNSGGRLTAVSL